MIRRGQRVFPACEDPPVRSAAARGATMPSTWTPYAVALLLLLITGGSLELGFRTGRRMKREGEQPVQLGTMQAGILGLLGLLLGFSFSGATGRFLERQELLVREANAIGTAFLRAELLNPADRDVIHAELREYGDARLELFKAVQSEPVNAATTRLDDIQRRLWNHATQGVQARPELTMAILPPLNEVFDLLAAHQAATGRHMPWLIAFLLLSCAAATIFCIGMGCGLAKKRQLGTAGVLTFLIATSLWATIDLDHPRIGLVRIDGSPMERLQQSLRPSPRP
jgi:hypothetical protein